MLQPKDIKDQSFKKGFMGYKSSEVDDYVKSVYRAYDQLFKENQELSEKLENVNANLQESRLKLFELENQVSKMENVSSYDEDDNGAAKKKADQIIKNAEEAAAEIIAKAKSQSKKFEDGTATGKSQDDAKASASSRFFKKSDDAPTSSSSDDDEIFVGEIEDSRKPERMMIGDGEEEEDLDFEFL